MAVFVFTDAAVTVNAVDLSDHVRTATLSLSADAQESTAMGATYRARVGGLKDWTLELEFNADFAAAKVDATLWPLLGTTSTVTVKPTSAANSTTNPQYSGVGLLTDYTPLDGSPGDMAAAPCTFQGAGTLSRLTV